MRKLLKITFGCFSVILLFIFLFYLTAKSVPLDIKNKLENITLYDMNHNVFYESNIHSNISWHSFNEFPDNVKELIVNIEDKRFYEHAGFDPIRIFKALFQNIKANKIVEGGSSISQQFAKNLFLTNKQTYSRKIEELFYAVQMEMQYSKEEILEGYLNTLYFGHGIYGFFDASEFFFNQPLSECSKAEIVTLIGIINGPGVYSPYIDMEACLNRKNLLLNYLYKENIFSNNEYEKYLSDEIIFAKEHYEEDNASYYIQSVLDELHHLNIDLKQGLDIYTSFDPYAQNTLSDSILKNSSKDDCQSSGIILSPSSGAVLAISGGKSYTSSEYIRPLYSKRQVGSAIKPLLYYNALQAGFTPSTTFLSSPTTFQIDETTTYSPVNYNSKYPNREISMINAISVSDNIYAVKTHLFLGMDVLSNSLAAFHIQSSPIPSLALGTSEMTLMELSSIYNTFASGGIYIKPYFIKAIFHDNNLIYKNEPIKKQLLDYDKTLILNQLLTATFDIKNKTVSFPTLTSMPMKIKISAKSGTSDFDTVVVGYNPDYTMGIWNGFDDARILEEKYYSLSKNIFGDAFNHLYDGKTVSGWYQKSKKIESRIVDPISGNESLLGSEYWYLKK